MSDPGLQSALFDFALLPKEADFSDAIKEPIYNFRLNALRSRCAIEGLTLVGMFLGVYEVAGFRAAHQLLGRIPFHDEADDENFKKTISPVLEKFADEQIADWNQSEEWRKRSIKRTRDNVDVILRLYSGDGTVGKILDKAVQKLFQDALIGAWTAIEVMIADLAKASIKLRAIQKPFKGAPWRILEMVEATRKINAETRPADRPNQVSFSSLENARISYARVFALDSAEIDECMASLDLDALYLVRNQLVHEGGKVKEKMVQFAKGIPALEACKVDEVILLEGATTRALVENALKVSGGLIRSVDTWLVNHL